MTGPLTTSGEGWPGAAYAIMALVKNVSGSNITQATVSSIALRVWPLSNPTQSSTASLTVASVVFDTLQTGNQWPTDRPGWESGYNFRYAASGSFCPREGEIYRHKFTFTMSDGGTLVLVHDHHTRRWNQA